MNTDEDAIPRKKKPPQPSSPDLPIPRKKSKPNNNVHSESTGPPLEEPAQSRNSSESTDRRKKSRFRIVSENPFVLSINTKGLNLGRPVSKRQRQSIAYKELEDTDSDDVMTEAEEHKLLEKRAKKRRKKVETHPDQASQEDIDALLRPIAVEEVNDDPNQIEAPPPGTLAALWYSHERFGHVWSVDKICGWKTRPKVQLLRASESPVETVAVSETKPEGADSDHIKETTETNVLSQEEAVKLQHKALNADEVWTDPNKRMEISRINPKACPFVMTMAANESNDKLKIQQVYGSDTKVADGFVDATRGGTREEVLLVKWRGRSHLHCSWERASDIQHLDPSTTNIARSKVRRFYQNQTLTFGPNWKQILEEERNTSAAIHHHGKVVADEDDDVEPVEEYFSPQCLEVERIMGCDENEMNMDVLATQRALNMIKEQEDLEKSENSPVAAATPRVYEEVPWDPEGNVCYVVKWKGLPYSEMTWEYWRNIKRYAVDEAEDFWYRQRAPSLDEAESIANRPHPHMRDFKKLQESPKYGISSKPRPIAKIEGHEEVISNGNGPDSDPDFRLRSYQLEGVNWLLFNWWNRRSCILADEMGLGKTIQSAAFLRELQSQPAAQVRGPFLIVAPLSLVSQWESELNCWAPDINVILYHGSADARDFLAREEFYYTDQFIPRPNAVKLKKQHITKFHVLITTYEVVLKDVNLLSKIRWRSLLVDEAHRLKNHRSKLFEELASVPRDHCVLLTGTPIANATEELWALLHFANPDIFNNREDFLEKFGEMTDSTQVNELHAVLKPYLLRRVKEDVEKSLPNKEETILEVSLTPIQKTFYKAIYERNTAFLFKGAKPNNAPSLMNVMMELRKCCNHPYLVKGAEDRILKDAAAKLEGKKDDGSKEASIDYGKLFEEQLVKSSGKMVLMEKLLQKLFNGGHKVLIFSQMVRVLDLLEELLKIKKYRYERLDGTTSSSSRLHAVERFKRKSCQRFVMLLSTRAGGLGLNLTAADIVIIFDSDWNPQNDLQAMARAHRIGQTRAVKVYRLLTAKTYEMHMFHSASLKLGLERAVLSQNREQNDESDEGTKATKKSEREAQAKEIDELLKKGAYDVFRDDDDKEAEKFMETDIDQLLEKSSKKVTYGASSTSSLGSGLGSFSKASFVANTDGGEKDVDLDDPDFWSKAVGLDAPPEEQPEEIAAMLDDGVKRQRRQVQQYDPYAELAAEEELKKERIALEKMMEREEKEKRREEKRRRKQKALDEKKKKQEPAKHKNDKAANVSVAKKPSPLIASAQAKLPKLSKELKPAKGTKKNARMLAQRRAANADPVIEKMKQAWEIPQRNRATAAAIRFGFGRFCKVRAESNLHSLPIQDLEVFVRSYVYQLALQVATTIMSRLQEGYDCDVGELVNKWIGVLCSQAEVDWIMDSVRVVLQLHSEVEQGLRGLRIPWILTEPVYVGDLRHGAGFRALRRVGVLARLNSFIEDCLDAVLLALGPDELGRRGCGPNDLSRLDADLKCRFVSTEELVLAICSRYTGVEGKAPATWWDRSCDVGLIVGTFIHGLGNYKAMLNDKTLPFSEKITKTSEQKTTSLMAAQRYLAAARATRQVFDDALEAGRIKAELEVQAAVAAAAKASAEREAAAAKVRMGGEEAEVAAKYLPETQVEDAFKFDGTDSHFVTLPRMHRDLQSAMLRGPSVSEVDDTAGGDEPGAEEAGSDGEEDRRYSRFRENHLLPMPDARVLDYRVLCLLNAVDDENTDLISIAHHEVWQVSEVVQTNMQVRNEKLSIFMKDAASIFCEYSGVGLGGFQCGISHRKLNDGSDYSFGSGSMQLSQLAYGTDAPRYLRALGVPMNMTRFAISGLLYAEGVCVDTMMEQEHLRYYGVESNGDNAASVCDTASPSAKTESVPPEIETNGSLAPSDNATSKVPSASSPALSTGDVGQDEESTPDSESPTIDPSEFMHETFRENASLRANVCVAALIYGVPSAKVPAPDTAAWASQATSTGPGDCSSQNTLFDRNGFREAVVALAPELEVPPAEQVMEYVESYLLPHCLRLCVAGNGPSTRNARGSRGYYETAFGISIHPEPSQLHPSPIPDPCLRLQEHSLEALGYANAILRRCRLLRSCTLLCSTNYKAPADAIVALTRSRSMCELEGEVPTWWCPWKHDIALLRRAATRGLFAVSAKRSDDPVFSDSALRQHIEETFFSSNASQEARHMSSASRTKWIEQQAKHFPTVFQMERRLASLCYFATADLEAEQRFEFLPMFDHGGWPRS